MRKWIPLTVAAVALAALTLNLTIARGQDEAAADAADAPAPATVPGLVTNKERASYGIGLNVGMQLRQQQLSAKDLDVDALAKGIADSLAGVEPRIPAEQIGAAFGAMRDAMTARQAAEAQANTAAGQTYLAENAKAQGVTVTDSGLQYQFLKAGEGKSPAATDRVRVHYKGMLTDGTTFDSSYDRGEPTEFEVNRLIPGWTEALQLMKEGAKYRLVIPPALAYGPRGAGDKIGPNAVLVFEMELLEVLPASE